MRSNRFMPGTSLVIGGLLALMVFHPATAEAKDATGLWRTISTDEGYLEVKIAPCNGGALCGTILRARDPGGSEQPYEHTGKLMIRDMKPQASGIWGGGRIWDPRNGMTFDSKMSLAGRQLTVSGCFLGFCQEQTWSRLE